MIAWGDRTILYLLLLVPTLAAAWLILERRRRNALHRLADAATADRLTASVNRRFRTLKNILFVTGLVLLGLSLARPRWGEKLQIYKGRGIDIVICLDASKSMFAQDIKPSRLERAKSDIAYLLDNLSTHRVGITAFAGEAYVMCPLTADVDAAKLFLDIIDPNTMPRPGTDLGRAIEVSASLFDPEEDAYKALVLVTDGDNLEGDPMPAVDAARSQGIRIFTVGMASLEGATIPDADRTTGSVTYKKDRGQKIVISRLADRLLLMIAKAANGRYYRSEGLYVNRLVDELDAMKKKELAGAEYAEYEERYQLFLLPAFILLFLSAAASDRRGRWFAAGTFDFIRHLPFSKRQTVIASPPHRLAGGAISVVKNKITAYPSGARNDRIKA